MGRTRHAAAGQRVRNIILGATWVCNARWAHLPLAKWLSRTSLAGDCSPQSRMTAHEHATTLRAAPSLSSLHRPTQVPSSFESGTCTRHHSEGAVSCCALKGHKVRQTSKCPWQGSNCAELTMDTRLSRTDG